MRGARLYLLAEEDGREDKDEDDRAEADGWEGGGKELTALINLVCGTASSAAALETLLTTLFTGLSFSAPLPPLSVGSVSVLPAGWGSAMIGQTQARVWMAHRIRPRKILIGAWNSITGTFWAARSI